MPHASAGNKGNLTTNAPHTPGQICVLSSDHDSQVDPSERLVKTSDRVEGVAADQEIGSPVKPYISDRPVDLRVEEPVRVCGARGNGGSADDVYIGCDRASAAAQPT